LTVFGQLRTAGGKAAEVQLRRSGTKAWKPVASATANAHGFVVIALKRARPGGYRIAWAGDGASRVVTVGR
jgi:hypothetical protein